MDPGAGISAGSAIFALPCLFLPFVFCAMTLGIAGFVIWIWMLIDCATNEPSTDNNKIVWVLVIVFTHWIGALIYLAVRRPQRIRQYGR